MSYVFGVDLGGTSIKLGLFDEQGALCDRWEIPTRSEDAGRAIIPDIARALMDKAAERGIAANEVAGVGIGVPGAVMGEGFVAPCVNLNGWGGFDVASALGDACGWDIRVLNDANAAALGEMAFGGGDGKKNVVFVTLGTGVGGGIIVDGHLAAGAHGAGGEIGHIKVTDEGPVCGCGKRGCLEQYASAAAIVRRAQEILASRMDFSELRSLATITCADVFQLAGEGDVIAGELVDDMVRVLGKALAGISCVCDPDVIVIGGGVARAGEMLTSKIAAHFRAYAFLSAEKTPIVLAKLGNDAGIYGAALTAMERCA